MAKSTSTLSQLNAQMSWSVIFKWIKFGQDLQITSISCCLWQLNFWHLKKKWHSSCTSPSVHLSQILSVLSIPLYRPVSIRSLCAEMRNFVILLLSSNCGIFWRYSSRPKLVLKVIYVPSLPSWLDSLFATHEFRKCSFKVFCKIVQKFWATVV